MGDTAGLTGLRTSSASVGLALIETNTAVMPMAAAAAAIQPAITRVLLSAGMEPLAPVANGGRDDGVRPAMGCAFMA